MGLFKKRPDPEYTPPAPDVKKTYFDKFEEELCEVLEKYNGIKSQIREIEAMPVPQEVKGATISSRGLESGSFMGDYSKNFGQYWFNKDSENICIRFYNKKVPNGYVQPTLEIENYNEMLKMAEPLGLSIDTKAKEVSDKSIGYFEKNTGNSAYRFVEKPGKPVMEMMRVYDHDYTYFVVNADKKYVSLVSSILKLGQTKK